MCVCACAFNAGPSPYQSSEGGGYSSSRSSAELEQQRQRLAVALDKKRTELKHYQSAQKREVRVSGFFVVLCNLCLCVSVQVNAG